MVRSVHPKLPEVYPERLRVEMMLRKVPLVLVRVYLLLLKLDLLECKVHLLGLSRAAAAQGVRVWGGCLGAERGRAFSVRGTVASRA
jgi:hypothetical protein